MRNFYMVLFAAFIMAAGFSVSSGDKAQAQPDPPGEPTYSEDSAENEREFARGRIIVKLEEDATPQDLRELNRENDARTEEDLPRSDLSVVDLPSDTTVQEGVEAYEDSADIEYAEPDFILQPTATPDDTHYENYMYALNNTGQTGGTSGADIDAPEAWDITTGDPDTLVAVIDEGADVNHPDLDDNLWVNEDEIPDNGIDDDKNGYVDDVNGWDFANDNASLYDPDAVTGEGDEHGTHVAGTIAAEGDNGRGVTGVNWAADIMVLKFLGANGGFTSDAVEAINYAVDNGAPISNNSWGGGGNSQALQEAIADADSEGHLFVAAAGNAGNDNDANPSYPASYTNSNVISVAATDDDDGLAGFSNYGEESVDLGAPGVGILSTVPGGYARYSGTSMASPHVAGVAALIKSQNPGLGEADLKSRILGSAESVSSLGDTTATGGRLDAAGALGVQAASGTDLTVAAGRSPLVFGAETALSGRLTDESGSAVADEEVVLQRRPEGTTGFRSFSKVTTSSDGTYRLTGIKPGKHTDYNARFAGSEAQGLEPSTSTEQRIDVKVLATNNTPQKNLKLGNGRAISGAVAPRHAGSTVRVTIKRNGEVINRRTVTLDRYSRYRTVLKPGRLGNYAVFAIFPKDADHLGNRSPQRSFKVVR